ncbi:TonB-dependent receptor [Marinilabiliaceae bacterium JC017]|nr:TonB-dependent receptor [Marinilabiliaceae bacterium JC017]
MKRNVLIRDKFLTREKSFIMRTKLRVLLLALLCCFSVYGQNQKIKIVGNVVDDDNLELPGVSIIEKGTTNGTISNLKGDYELILTTENPVLLYSFIGFEKEEIVVGEQREINITLHDQINDLNEVVVVGFGTNKKANLTGAVETIDQEVLENRPVSDLSQALQGVVPGLNLSRTSNGGKPGIAMVMSIRGAGSPYVLIDGVEGSIQDLNPDDIETVTVLKDAASASIYGAKAAYGVVLVTTKSGKKGTKIKYSNNFSFSTPSNLPKQANSFEYAKFFNAASVNCGGTPLVSVETMERIKRYINEGDIDGTIPNPMDPNYWANTEYGNANSDWFDFHFKDRALQQTHNFSVSGASDKIDYYISASTLDQEGIIAHGDDSFDRSTIHGKVNAVVNDWFSVNSNMSYTDREVDMPTFLMLNGNMMHRIAQARWPSTPIYDPNGHYMKEADVNEIENGGRTLDVNNSFRGSFGFKLEPIKNWITEFSYDWSSSLWKQQMHRNSVFTYYNVHNEEYKFGDLANSNYYIYTGIKDFSSPKVHTTYSKSVGNHNFKIMGGFQQTKNEYHNHSTGRSKVLSASLPSISTSTGKIIGNEGKGHCTTRSYFGRINYDYKEKYLLEFNFRGDGSSYFQEDNRWGYFPSFSAGYNIAKESFWAPLQYYVNHLKFRGSYGSLGDQTSYGYQYLETYQVLSDYPWLMENSKKPNVVYMPNVPSKHLTWETISMLTFGLDAGMLNNRLTLNFDWYKRDRSDILGPSVTIPATYGGNIPNSNNVEIETKGFEIALGWQDRIGDFSYNVRATLENYKSEYKKYNNPTDNLFIPYEGQTVGEIWGYTSRGLFQSEEEVAEAPDQSRISADAWHAGDVRYEDINGDGEVNNGKSTLDDHGDLKVIGNWMPQYQYGINLGAKYKNLGFSMFWQGVAKQDAFLTGNFFFGSANGRWQTTCFEEHLDYWTEDNKDAYFPRPTLNNEGVIKNQQTSTRYLQNTAYLRLKNIQVYYNLPKKLIEKIKLQNAQIYVSAENILTFTELPDTFDPEALSGINGYSSGKTYPMQKSVSLGLNLTF